MRRRLNKQFFVCFFFLGGGWGGDESLSEVTSLLSE